MWAWLVSVGLRLRARVRGDDDALHEELQAHLDQLEAQHRDSGLTPRDARAAAYRQFGNVTRIHEQTSDLYRFRVVDTVLRDLRMAARHLRRAPGVTVVAIITLALGVGASAAIFSLYDALMLRPLPVHEPERLVGFSQVLPDGRSQVTPLATLAAFSERQRSFDNLCAVAGGALLTIEVNGTLVPSGVDFVTGECFDTLGVRPHLGRFITTADVPLIGTPAPVVVLGYRFWQQQYGAGPNVVGQTLRVQGVPLTIVGVADSDYGGLRIDVVPDVTVPLQLLDEIFGRPPNPARPLGATLMVGRLGARVTPEQARTELDTLWPSIRDATVPPGFYPTQRERFLSTHMAMISLETGLAFSPQFVGATVRDSYATVLLLLLALAGVLLGVACVNLSGLLLTRTAMREHELRTRIALGASRARLIQGLLAQGFVLAVLGSVVALPIVWVTIEVVNRELSMGTHALLTPDLGVLAVTLSTAVAIGTTISLIPAWAVGRLTADNQRRDARTISRTTRPLTRGLLVAQVALSFALVAGAGLLVRSLAYVWNSDPGFEADGLHLVRLIPQPHADRDVDTETYYPELVTQLTSLPGVQSVSLSRLFPYVGDANLVRQGVSAADSDHVDAVMAAWDNVSPGFFRTAGIPQVDGRDFEWTDGPTAPSVAIINRALARQLFPTNRAVGQVIRFDTGPGQGSFEIVGIVSDATMGDLRAEHLPVVYRPWLQGGGYTRSPVVQLRTTGDVMMLRDQVRETAAALGEEYVLEDVAAMSRLRTALARERLAASVSSVSGILAVLIAAIGLYGALAYSVTRRTPEIAVRMALGASRRSIFRLVVSEGVYVVALGLTIGLALALVATRTLGSLLFGIGPNDPTTLATVTVLLIVVACGACSIPAYKATSVDPMVSLRHE